jgi:hypothetical protein
MLLNVFREYRRQRCSTHMADLHHRVCLVCEEDNPPCLRKYSAAAKPASSLDHDDSIFPLIVNALASHKAPQLAVSGLFQKLTLHVKTADPPFPWPFPVSFGDFVLLCNRAKQKGLVSLGGSGASAWIKLAASSEADPTAMHSVDLADSVFPAKGFRRADTIDDVFKSTASSVTRSRVRSESPARSLGPPMPSVTPARPRSHSHAVVRARSRGSVETPEISDCTTPISPNLVFDDRELAEEDGREVEQQGTSTVADILNDMSSSDDEIHSETPLVSLTEAENSASEDETPSFTEISAADCKEPSASAACATTSAVESAQYENCRSCNRIRDGDLMFFALLLLLLLVYRYFECMLFCFHHYIILDWCSAHFIGKHVMKDVIKEYFNLRRIFEKQRKQLVRVRSCYTEVVSLENRLFLAKSEVASFEAGS